LSLFENFSDKHEGFLIFVCFFGSALVGYVLMNHFAIFGVWYTSEN